MCFSYVYSDDFFFPFFLVVSIVVGICILRLVRACGGVRGNAMDWCCRRCCCCETQLWSMPWCDVPNVAHYLRFSRRYRPTVWTTLRCESRRITHIRKHFTVRLLRCLFRINHSNSKFIQYFIHLRREIKEEMIERHINTLETQKKKQQTPHPDEGGKKNTKDGNSQMLMHGHDRCRTNLLGCVGIARTNFRWDACVRMNAAGDFVTRTISLGSNEVDSWLSRAHTRIEIRHKNYYMAHAIHFDLTESISSSKLLNLFYYWII